MAGLTHTLHKISKTICKERCQETDSKAVYFSTGWGIMPHIQGYISITGKMNICVLPWVSQSPDLNPSERLWDHLGKVVDEIRPTSLPDLKQKLSAAWESIEPEIT